MNAPYVQAPPAALSLEPMEAPAFESFAAYEQRVLAAEGEQEWLVEDLIPRRGLVMLAGEAMRGKSLTLQVIVAASQAEESHACLAGLLVEEAKVHYLHLEHQGTTLTRNLRAAAKARATELPNVSIGTSLDLDSDDAVEQLRVRADAAGVDVIIIDPLRRATVGNENDSNDTAEWGRRLRLLTSEGRRLVIVVHHVGKTSSGPRGSTDLKAMVDTLVTLTCTGDTVTLTAEHHHAPNKQISFQFCHDEAGGTLDVVAVGSSGANPRRGLTREQIADRVADYVAHNPGVTSSVLRAAVIQQLGGVRNGDVKVGRDLALQQGRIRFERVGRTDCWFPANSAPALVAPGGM